MKEKYQKLVSQAAESDHTVKTGEKKIIKLQDAIEEKKEDDKEVEENINLAKKAPGLYTKDVSAHEEAA